MGQRDLKLAIQILVENGQLKLGLSDSEQRVNRFSKEAQGGFADLGKQVGVLRNQLLGLFAVNELSQAVAAVIRQADAWQQLNARVAVAVGAQGDAALAMDQVYQVAQSTRSGLDGIAALYERVMRSAQDLGLSQREVATVTELMAKGLKLSGATAAETDSTIIQLSQALASGVLRGEEFNSIMESGGRVARALADGLGVPIGKLRALAEAGELTADKVIGALLSQNDVLAAEYARLPVTVEQSLTVLSNAWTKYLGEVNDSTGATQALAGAVQAVADNLPAIVNAGAVGVMATLGLTIGKVVLALRAKVLALRDVSVAQAAELATMRAKTQADLAAAQGNMNVARTALQSAQATLAQAEAAAAAATGFARLALIESRVLPARRALTLATEQATLAQHRLSAATTVAGAAATATATGVGLLSRALGLLTGPFGLVITLLGTALPAFLAFRDGADEAAGKTRGFAASLDDVLAAADKFSLAEIEQALYAQVRAWGKADRAVRDYRQRVAELEAELADSRAGGAESLRLENDLRQARADLEAATHRMALEQDKLNRIGALYRDIQDGTYEAEQKRIVNYAKLQTAIANTRQALDELLDTQGKLLATQQEALRADQQAASARYDAIGAAVAAQQAAEAEAQALAAAVPLRETLRRRSVTS